MPYVVEIDFTIPAAAKPHNAYDPREALRQGAPDKVIVKGIPPSEMWEHLRNIVHNGSEIEFANVFEVSDIEHLSDRDAAQILDEWRSVVANMKAIQSYCYDLRPNVATGGLITALNSLEQAFITVSGACMRREQEAEAQRAALLSSLRSLKLMT